MKNKENDPERLEGLTPGAATAGLGETPKEIGERLRRAGIDPKRLSIYLLGRPRELLRYPYPLWARRMLMGYLILLVLVAGELDLFFIPLQIAALLSLLAGLIIIQAACQALVSATEAFAARFNWDHYVAGTVSEILSTLPECVVIAFLIPVSPSTAFLISLITIYNNTLVFSLYSYFLPKDRKGEYVMPNPITQAGTQILIAGGALGLTLGLVMLVFSTGQHPKRSFEPLDLVFISLIMLLIFSVYLHKLIKNYSKEEKAVRDTLKLSHNEINERRATVYKNIELASFFKIGVTGLLGIAGAFFGGEKISQFAEFSVKYLGLNGIITALILAIFAGMSEYVILYTSHRKNEYGIALANAFGGITQVTFLIFPFTLLGIAVYQMAINPNHPDLPLGFSISNILLLVFLFPTFYTLTALIEKDHTFGILDTTIMTCVVFLLLMLLMSYGAEKTTGVVY